MNMSYGAGVRRLLALATLLDRSGWGMFSITNPTKIGAENKV
jgi:hypothetical protein